METQRLVLRELSSEDLESVHRVKANKEVVKFLTWGPNNLAATRNSLDKQIGMQEDNDRKIFVLGIVLKESNQLIGNCLLTQNDFRTAEFGYFIHPDYWQVGYGTETAKALIGFGFNTLKLHRLIATCDPENVASIKVLKKSGMRLEGHFIKAQYVKGLWRDNMLFAMLVEEYI
ncbi:GCN5 family acetyltransferase [Desulfitobacterium metallireducens DSM 15288]|uniref:GCN5 family acetyltransferase n=1 Tax=Desulfitobacterium metallireducens DSM 15288 TaxID=871968 RepID=W0EAU8_9FIRM|nr:GCN5 family acetyltransferase [Desulfitobacterium metallireducens DSM 15288]